MLPTRYTRAAAPLISVLIDPQLHTQVQPRLALLAAQVAPAADAAVLLHHLWARPVDLVLIETASQAPAATVALVAEVVRYFPAPILIVERGAGEAERIAWLDSGADDILTLCDPLLELPARCAALLRRSQRQRRRDPDTGYLRALGMRLDIPGRRVLLPGGATLELSAAQTRLLALLLAQQGGVVPTQVLHRHLAAGGPRPQTERLRPVLRDLRDRLSRAGSPTPQIVYVPRCGYRIMW